MSGLYLRHCSVANTAFCAGVTAALLLFTLPANAQSRTCSVTDISGGSASLLRAGETLRNPINTPIEPGDRLQKSKFAQVLITCSDQGEISIGRASEVDLGPLITAPVGEKRVFRLLRGIAGFVMPTDAAPVEVQTLNAVASVRSTEWTVEIEDGMTHVFVRKGLVNVSGTSGGSADLAGGEGITVMPDGTLGLVKTWGKSRIDAMNERLGGGWR